MNNLFANQGPKAIADPETLKATRVCSLRMWLLPYSNMGYDVFISHSAKDKVAADAVCAALEADGITCWIAPRDIDPGRDWSEAVIDAIGAAKAMVLVFSKHSNESEQVKREVSRAVSGGLTVVPLRLEDVPMNKSLLFFLGNTHRIDALPPPLEQHLRAFTLKVRGLLHIGADSAASGIPDSLPVVSPQAPVADKARGSDGQGRKYFSLRSKVGSVGCTVSMVFSLLLLVAGAVGVLGPWRLPLAHLFADKRDTPSAKLARYRTESQEALTIDEVNAIRAAVTQVIVNDDPDLRSRKTELLNDLDLRETRIRAAVGELDYAREYAKLISTSDLVGAAHFLSRGTVYEQKRASLVHNYHQVAPELLRAQVTAACSRADWSAAMQFVNDFRNDKLAVEVLADQGIVDRTEHILGWIERERDKRAYRDWYSNKNEMSQAVLALPSYRGQVAAYKRYIEGRKEVKEWSVRIDRLYVANDRNFILNGIIKIEISSGGQPVGTINGIKSVGDGRWVTVEKSVALRCARDHVTDLSFKLSSNGGEMGSGSWQGTVDDLKGPREITVKDDAGHANSVAISIDPGQLPDPPVLPIPEAPAELVFP